MQNSDGQYPVVPDKSFNDWMNEGRRVNRILTKLFRKVDDDPKTFEIHTFFKNCPVVCQDGYSVSIQASAHHYCHPRRHSDDIAYYDHFELGFPSEADDLLMEWMEDIDPTRSVYPYVPREVVETLIAKHGGIVRLVELPEPGMEPIKCLTR